MIAGELVEMYRYNVLELHASVNGGKNIGIFNFLTSEWLLIIILVWKKENF